jgi:(1->4)-alpha-D-glucan 1-alpha-D-glucosylmutase
LNLVDPDNRRPVDYEKRREALAAMNRCATSSTDCAAELLEHRTDGRVKLFVTARTLSARAAWRDVYEQGDYVPLQTSGSRGDHVFAFARRHGDAVAITCVPRLVASLIPDASGPPIGSVWGDTRIELAPVIPAVYKDVFTGTIVEPDEARTLSVAALFERFPVALLVPANRSDRRDPADLSGPPAPPAPPG